MAAQIWKKRSLRAWFVTALFFFCFVFFFVWLAVTTVPEQTRIVPEYSAWRQNGELLAEYPFPEEGVSDEALQYGGRVTVKLSVPEMGTNHYPYLVLYPSQSGERFRDLTVSLASRALTLPLTSVRGATGGYIITLPPGCGGTVLTISYWKAAGYGFFSAYLTDTVTEFRVNSSSYAVNALPAAIFATLTLMLAGLFLFGLLTDDPDWSLLILSLISLSRVLCHMGLNAYTQTGQDLALIGANGLLYLASPLYLLLLIRNRKRRFLSTVCIGFSGIVFLVLALGKYRFPILRYASPYAGDAFYLAAVVLLVCFFLERRAGRTRLKQLLPGLLPGPVLLFLNAAYCPPMDSLLRLVWSVAQYIPFFARMSTSALFVTVWNLSVLFLCAAVSLRELLLRLAERDAEERAIAIHEKLTGEQLDLVRAGKDALEKAQQDASVHYSVIRGLYTSGKVKRMEEYLSRLVNEREEDPPVQYCEHEAIDAVLSFILTDAQKKGILVRVNADVPAYLPFPNQDLCSMMLSLLQNAVQANARSNEGRGRWINVNLRIKDPYLLIGVENSLFTPLDYDESTGLYRSTDPDKATHGFGLKAVQAVAKRHSGKLLLKVDDNRFSACVILPLPD